MNMKNILDVIYSDILAIKELKNELADHLKNLEDRDEDSLHILSTAKGYNWKVVWKNIPTHLIYLFKVENQIWIKNVRNCIDKFVEKCVGGKIKNFLHVFLQNPLVQN